MTFGEPWVLAFLVLPLGALWWVWGRRARRVAMPFDHGRAGRGVTLSVFVRIAESIPALLLAVAILLLAGPRKQDAPKQKRALTNIQFCVDISGSMNSKLGEARRYDAAMTAINQFLDYRSGDAFGLTFFGHNVLHWVPLTSDTSAFRCAPPFMDPRKVPSWFNGTAIGKALLACRKVLVDREEGDRMIILVSDGASSDLGGGSDMDVAKKLRDDGIVVYAVHIAEGEVPGPVVNIATVTGGMAFEPGDKEALDLVFRRIDEMQQTEMEKIAAEQVDDFELLCWIGLSLLGLLALTQFALRYTPW